MDSNTAALQDKINASRENEPMTSVLITNTETPPTSAQLHPANQLTSSNAKQIPIKQKPKTQANPPQTTETSAAIEHSITEKLKPFDSTPDDDDPISDIDVFSIMKITQRLELDTGNNFQIDVQPDFRFFYLYACHCISQLYPKIDVKMNNYVSFFSLIAYDQILYNACLLMHDLYNRTPRSFFATHFRTNKNKSEFFSKLLTLKVPDHMMPIIQHMNDVKDEQLTNVRFTPSLAAFDFLLDYGRMVPPLIMIQAHCILASNPANAAPDDTLLAFYAKPIVTIQQKEYFVSNFLGGPFHNYANDRLHENWLILATERVFNPVVSRALNQRPTLARPRIVPLYYENAADVDPYEFQFALTKTNQPILEQMLDNISKFYKVEDPDSPTLSEIFSDRTGTVIQTHSVEPASLPTWHCFDKPEISVPKLLSAQEFAKIISFMPPLAEQTSTCTPLPEDLDPNFSLRGKDDFIPLEYPFKVLTFNEDRDITPDVLWFQPYNQVPEYIKISCIYGIKIESEDIDGIAIPLPNPAMDLATNNSFYRTGLIPLPLIARICAPAHPMPILFARRDSSTQSQSIGLAYRDMSRVIVPQFASSRVRTNITSLLGVSLTPNCAYPDYDWTYAAWKHGTDIPLPKQKIHLWSSYRHVENSDRPTRSISLYCTLRPIYGLSVPLARTRYPALILPS